MAGRSSLMYARSFLRRYIFFSAETPKSTTTRSKEEEPASYTKLTNIYTYISSLTPSPVFVQPVQLVRFGQLQETANKITDGRSELWRSQSLPSPSFAAEAANEHIRLPQRKASAREGCNCQIRATGGRGYKTTTKYRSVFSSACFNSIQTAKETGRVDIRGGRRERTAGNKKETAAPSADVTLHTASAA
jgi:hypothetical protein